VLAAEYSGKAGTWRAIWFDPGGTRPPGYYNERGESVVRSLLKSPLKFVRVASSFDKKRFHPVLHTERSHLGVDFGAPTGTPVWAVASGKVSFKGNRGPEGESVVIQHPGGMETVYTHLSQFARGLEVGDEVRQKQVIGYVGQSGGAPAPHLHFSVRLGGHYVDPLRLKPAREPPLPTGLREAFFAAAAPRLEGLARVEIHPVRRDKPPTSLQ
jgi:murein DD-endopeptidase MepM/ murein hydrolase activator NlpD